MPGEKQLCHNRSAGQYYPIMTSPEELSGKTAVLCAEGYLESSQIQDADSNTFMGIRDM